MAFAALQSRPYGELSAAILTKPVFGDSEAFDNQITAPEIHSATFMQHPHHSMAQR
tara:strand:- start:1176 stop:1343 length:168 start_codon:yes stop_codon:yes gene_type:complete